MPLPYDIERDRVSVSAAKTRDGKLFVSLINLQLSASSVDAVNSYDRPDAIVPRTLRSFRKRLLHALGGHGQDEHARPGGIVNRIGQQPAHGPGHQHRQAKTA